VKVRMYLNRVERKSMGSPIQAWFEGLFLENPWVSTFYDPKLGRFSKWGWTHLTPSWDSLSITLTCCRHAGG
jgi:hypothetical protein